MSLFHRHGGPEHTQSHSRSDPPAMPMMNRNGLVILKPNRHASSDDYDLTPITFRRFIETGARDVQLRSGVQRHIASGILLNPARLMVNGTLPPEQGWLAIYQNPRNPGSAHAPGTYGGTHKRGIDPLSYGAMFDATAGAQPSNPGGPGRIAAPMFFNPMTG